MLTLDQLYLEMYAHFPWFASSILNAITVVTLSQSEALSVASLSSWPLVGVALFSGRHTKFEYDLATAIICSAATRPCPTTCNID